MPLHDDGNILIPLPGLGHLTTLTWTSPAVQTCFHKHQQAEGGPPGGTECTELLGAMKHPCQGQAEVQTQVLGQDVSPVGSCLKLAHPAQYKTGTSIYVGRKRLSRAPSHRERPARNFCRQSRRAATKPQRPHCASRLIPQNARIGWVGSTSKDCPLWSWAQGDSGKQPCTHGTTRGEAAPAEIPPPLSMQF